MTCPACHGFNRIRTVHFKEIDVFSHQTDVPCPCVALAAAEQRVADIEAELLRVRTTGHGAAHELDNIAIELGLGHSPQAGVVAVTVRRLKALAGEGGKP